MWGGGAQWTIWPGHKDRLEIKKIYQRIINNVNLSVLKLQKRYLHQNGVEFYQKYFRDCGWPRRPWPNAGRKKSKKR